MYFIIKDRIFLVPQPSDHNIRHFALHFINALESFHFIIAIAWPWDLMAHCCWVRHPNRNSRKKLKYYYPKGPNLRTILYSPDGPIVALKKALDYFGWQTLRFDKPFEMFCFILIITYFSF